MPVDDERILPVKLDITVASEIAAVADSCTDVNLLINNAGVLRNSPALAEDSQAAARIEMETNFFGTLAMTRAFAPILARNGGGTIVNILSVASWFGNPMMATYCASKAAELALTNSIRIELRPQNTQVIAVFAVTSTPIWLLPSLLRRRLQRKSSSERCWRSNKVSNRS
jgi:short-subunit dehydrogenase